MSDPHDLSTLGRIPESSLKEAREANRIDRERVELFEVMVKTPGWKAYRELLEKHIESQGSILLNPAGSVDGAILQEYEKGTMRGLILARDLPALTIQRLRSLTSDPDTENSE